MGNRIRCFLLEATEMAEKLFRRYANTHYLEDAEGKYIRDSDGKVTLDPAYEETNHCSGPYSYHNAEVLVDANTKTAVSVSTIPEEEERQDARWPEVCSGCGYVFREDDHWQVTYERLYLRTDTHELVSLRKAPVGALWDAPWMGERYRRGSDGKCFVLRTPGGDWTIDGPSSGGGQWERTGIAPDLTATPSILFPETKNTEGRVISPGYHGWLRNGWLEEC